MKKLLTILCALLIGLWIMAPMAAAAETETDTLSGCQQSVSGSLQSADITVRSGGKTLTLTGSKWIMLEGRKIQLRILARPSTNVRSVGWSSSDKKIAGISSDGKVKANAKGTAKITAIIYGRDGNTVKKTVRIKVIAKTLKNKGKYKGVSKWRTDISDIEQRYEDKPQGQVIFYGNSSIRKWETLERDMSNIPVLNHGFGGSTVNDCLYYADRMIVPFNPRAIVFYAGTSDAAHGYSKKTIFRRTKEFFEYIHCRLPETQIYYISMPLQPRRIDHWPTVRELNKEIRDYCKNDPLVTFINASAALNKGSLSERSKYFVGDGIHLTAEGYKAWTKVIRPVLADDGYAE